MRSLILFTSPTCASCPAFKALVTDVAAKAGVPVRLVDISTYPDTAQGYGIRSVPTLLILDDGQVRGQVGVVPRSRLEALLES